VTGVWVLLVVLLAVAALGLLRWRKDGRLKTVARATAAPVPPDLAVLQGIGFVPDQADVTFVQFSSAFCSPCRATRAILGDVAATIDGVRHIEVDAESHLEAVRALRVMKTPTTLVVDRAGVVVQRAAGQPRKADVVAAVGRLVLSAPGVTSHVSEGETR
jgi:thiol-disulfide isomerase/thioredoxin